MNIHSDKWPLLLLLGLAVLVWLWSVLDRRTKRRSERAAFEDTDMDMAKQYGANWRELAWSGQTRRVNVRDVGALTRDLVGDLSPAQQAAEHEKWIREHKDYFGRHYRGHIQFLLRRLDEARGASR